MASKEWPAGKAPMRSEVRPKVIRMRGGYGRDALFEAHRLRQDYWRNHKQREELLLYKQRIADNQRRAEHTNEVRRLDGFLQHNLTYNARNVWLKDVHNARKTELLKKMGVAALPDD